MTHLEPPTDAPDPAPPLDPATIEAELDDVARALDRLDEGTYGTCEGCGAALADDVLAVSPAARWCDEHAPAAC